MVMVEGHWWMLVMESKATRLRLELVLLMLGSFYRCFIHPKYTTGPMSQASSISFIHEQLLNSLLLTR